MLEHAVIVFERRRVAIMNTFRPMFTQTVARALAPPGLDPRGQSARQLLRLSRPATADLPGPSSAQSIVVGHLS